MSAALGNGVVRISRQLGEVHSVSLDPPVPWMLASTSVDSFSHAMGMACGYAIGLGRRIVDETGRISPEQSEQLVAAIIGGAIDEGFKRLIQGKPFLPEAAN